LILDGEKRPIKPRFRESAYTPIKKVVGEEIPPDFDEMRVKVDTAVAKAIEKKRRVLETLFHQIP
jgi:hydrogenase expression/formation protein